VICSETLFAASRTEVAVTVAICVLETLDGALYVTELIV